MRKSEISATIFWKSEISTTIFWKSEISATEAGRKIASPTKTSVYRSKFMLKKKNFFMIIMICLLLISCSKSTNPFRSYVERVSVSPALIYTTSGSNIELYSRVYGVNLDDYTTSWIIAGQIANTTIDTNGLLTIDKYEIASTILATAISNFDKKTNANSMVNIVHFDIYDVPDFSENEYFFDMYLFDFLGGHGWILARLEYNSIDLVRPPIDPIVNMKIGGVDIKVSLSWNDNQKYYYLSISGLQNYISGQKISIEIITANGTALWETTIPHKPQFVNIHEVIENYPNSYDLQDDINITWEIKKPQIINSSIF